MAKNTSDKTFEDMLSVRLKWALESTIKHWLGRPDMNAIEDWADALAYDMGTERDAWQRPPASQTRNIPETVTATPKNGKVTSLTL